MKTLTIKKSSDFKKISQKNDKFFSKNIVLLRQKTPKIYEKNQKQSKNLDNFCRLGLTVNKRVGNSPARNKAKRRIRAAFKELVANYGENHYDYVVIARSIIANSDYKKILSDLKFCMKNIGKNYETKR